MALVEQVPHRQFAIADGEQHHDLGRSDVADAQFAHLDPEQIGEAPVDAFDRPGKLEMRYMPAIMFGYNRDHARRCEIATRSNVVIRLFDFYRRLQKFSRHYLAPYR
ncbi:hypothetical protein K32_18890 [Kaistia sp. 32K]|nr:hypothetical protein K32_18890 [Kaistia sp. 32K]